MILYPYSIRPPEHIKDDPVGAVCVEANPVFTDTDERCPLCEGPLRLFRVEGRTGRVVEVLQHRGDMCDVIIAAFPSGIQFVKCNACRISFTTGDQG